MLGPECELTAPCLWHHSNVWGVLGTKHPLHTECECQSEWPHRPDLCTRSLAPDKQALVQATTSSSHLSPRMGDPGSRLRFWDCTITPCMSLSVMMGQPHPLMCTPEALLPQLWVWLALLSQGAVVFAPKSGVTLGWARGHRRKKA